MPVMDFLVFRMPSSAKDAPRAGRGRLLSKTLSHAKTEEEGLDVWHRLRMILDCRVPQFPVFEGWGYLLSSSDSTSSPSASLVQHLVRPQIVAQVDLARARDFLLGIEQHLFPLRDPAAGARNREEDGEHGHPEAHGLIDQASIKIHVGIKLAGDEVVVLQGDALAFERDV